MVVQGAGANEVAVFAGDNFGGDRVKSVIGRDPALRVEVLLRVFRF
jgi:hypothetical protein